MSKLFCILALFISFTSKAQSLTLNNLIALHKMDIGAMQSNLEAKGFNLMPVIDDNENTSQKIAKWTYSKGSNQNINAIAIIETKNFEEKKFIEYKFVNKEFKRILDANVTQYKLIKIKSGINEHGIYTLYYGENYAVVFTAQALGKGSSPITMHIVSVIKKEDLVHTDLYRVINE